MTQQDLGDAQTRKSVFFAYPSSPTPIREPAARGADLVAGTGLVDTVPWETLKVSGRFIIDDIVDNIVTADVTAAVLTALNHNVLFEVGVAVGAGRRTWLLLDPTFQDSQQQWAEFRVLSTIGYSPYNSGEDIRAEFLRERPEESREPILDHLTLEPAAKSSLLYLRPLYRTDPDVVLGRALASQGVQRGFELLTVDPGEGSVYPLSWYAQQVYAAECVVVHVTPQSRSGSFIHNARCSLVAGLARGMQRPLLILADDNYLAPIDYRDTTHIYSDSNDCRARALQWLDSVTLTAPNELKARAERHAKLRLATELASLRLGEDVAEYEADRLERYFVETYGYKQVLERRTTLFVGRKGTGKTANFLRAAAALRADKRNLVVLIKPQSYEVEAVLGLLARYGEREARSHLVNALWQYLLYTEIARTAAIAIRSLPAGVAAASDDERALLEYFDRADHALDQDFAVRLERAASRLTEASTVSGVESSRDAIAQALHAGELQGLRRLLGDGLQRWSRVAVLIDNLDKGWDRGADVAELAHLLLGLLSAIGQVADEFAKTGTWRKAVDTTLAVFLRTDIFYAVTRIAREPDKIPQSRLLWSDPEVLLRVVEARYVAARDPLTNPQDLWSRYFPETVNGQAIREYLTWRALPRPRDLLHLCNAAIAVAVDAGHDRVLENDIVRGEAQYSQFALEALRVENGITIAQMGDVLTGFLGVSSTLSQAEAMEIITSAGIQHDESAGVLRHLIGLSFLGVEVRPGEFVFPEDPDQALKAERLSERLDAGSGGAGRLQVHPAFRPYLETP